MSPARVTHKTLDLSNRNNMHAIGDSLGLLEPHDLARTTESKAQFLPYSVFLTGRIMYRRFSYATKKKISPFALYETEGIIFLHVPKNAGTFVNGIVYPSYSSEVATHINAHHSAQYLSLLNRKKFSRLSKFSILRHPGHRLRSAFNYLKFNTPFKTDTNFAETALARFSDFTEFVETVSPEEFSKLLEWPHFQPQVIFITNAKGMLLVDALTVVERLDEGLRTIGNHYGKNWHSDIRFEEPKPLPKKVFDLVARFYPEDLTLWEKVNSADRGCVFL